MEKTVNPQESTIANADLWARYFQEQLGGSASPLAPIAEGAAAQVASFLTFLAAGPIAWLYSANAPEANDVVPRPQTEGGGPTQLERTEPETEFDSAA